MKIYNTLILFLFTFLAYSQVPPTIEKYMPVWVENTCIASEHYSDILYQTSIHFDTLSFPEYFKKAILDYRISNNLVNDKKIYRTKGMIRDSDNNISIKSLNYKIEYLYGEICGGMSAIKTHIIQDTSIKELLCLFRPKFDIQSRSLKLDTLMVKTKNDSYLILNEALKKNINPSFIHNEKLYQIEYKAKLKSNRENSLVYTDLEIRLKLENGNNWQTLYKNDSNKHYEISDLLYGDIDGDSKLDVILKLCTEFCVFDLYYLSSKSTENLYVKYIGQATNCEL